VPDDEVNFFVEITNPVWNIRAESDFLNGYSKDDIDGMMAGENVGRSGWYLQQFLKINAMIDPVLKDNDFVLIWDADTVPLKKIIYFENTNNPKLQFYSGREYHIPYFITMKNIFNLERVGNFSFIAQNLPSKVAWVRKLIECSPDYIGLVLSSLQGKSASEFSEYETIGSFIFSRYPSSVMLNKRAWLRGGNSFFGLSRFSLVNRVILFIWSFFYDYVAFEKY
jgi:hypothetical protein